MCSVTSCGHKRNDDDVYSPRVLLETTLPPWRQQPFVNSTVAAVLCWYSFFSSLLFLLIIVSGRFVLPLHFHLNRSFVHLIHKRNRFLKTSLIFSSSPHHLLYFFPSTLNALSIKLEGKKRSITEHNGIQNRITNKHFFFPPNNSPLIFDF